MSIRYKVVKQVFGFDPDKKEKYVARSVTGELVTSDKLRDRVTQVTGLHRGVVNHVIDGVLDSAVDYLELGHSVQIGDFCILRPAIRAASQDSEEAITANTIYRRKINFVPGKMLRNFIKDVPVTRMAMPDVDYTDGSSRGNNPDDGDGDGGFTPDPNA